MRLPGIALLVGFAVFAPRAEASGVVSVQGQNQLEYSLSSEADRDSTVPREIFENWLDADIRFDRFLAGFRYEAFLPHELRPDSLRQGIVQRYAQAEYPFGGIRAGNFYGIFGRGLLFRSYEDRSIRIDGNMDGVLLWGEKGRFKAKAFSGRIREIETDERTAVLRGADLGVDAGMGLGFGGSYLIQSAPNPNPAGYVVPPAPRHTEAIGGRLSFIHQWFDVYYEGGRINRLFLTSSDRARGTTYDDLRGTGHYAALSVFPFGGLSITAEYKEYERFRFQPAGSRGTDYNNPPAATRETSYALISRHPHQLDPNNEKGFQIEAVAAPIAGSTVTLSRAESNRLNGKPFFHEWYAEWRQELGGKYSAAVVYDYIRDEETGSKNHTPIVEFGYHPGGEWSIRSEYQYQQSEVTLGTERNQLALVEFHATYDLVFSVVGEHTASLVPSFDPDNVPCAREKRDDFFYGQVDWFFSQQHHLSLMAGKRRAGFICVGGVCRFEPEFEGIECKLVSTF
jgi:hypothetical protein